MLHACSQRIAQFLSYCMLSGGFKVAFCLTKQENDNNTHNIIIPHEVELVVGLKLNVPLRLDGLLFTLDFFKTNSRNKLLIIYNKSVTILNNLVVNFTYLFTSSYYKYKQYLVLL